jgi:hypothetical protein
LIALNSTDPDVEGTGRRGLQAGPGHRPEPGQGLSGLGGDLARATYDGPEAPGELGGHGGALEQSIGQQLGRRRQRPRDPVVLRRGDRHRIRRGVEQHRDDVDARDAVNQRVMRLGKQREAVVGEPLHQP